MSQEVSGVERITDVEWTLDLVSARSQALAGDLQYSITMKTQSGRDVTFACDAQQLQDLVTKFKEIIHHAETLKAPPKS